MGGAGGGEGGVMEPDEGRGMGRGSGLGWARRSRWAGTLGRRKLLMTVKSVYKLYIPREAGSGIERYG